MDTLLQVKDLSVFFKTSEANIKVLKELCYQLNAGETLSIVGESGSGKTVHALSILRLMSTNAKITGEIIFKNENLSVLPESKLKNIRGKKIAMIFQDPMTSLNPVMTIGSQIYETLLTHKKATKKNIKEKTLSLLKSVEIPDAKKKLDSYPHEFSGGQRQRIMIAMALACEPDILIADEPTTALDVTIQKQILALLKKLQEERKTALIFITHNLALVNELGGRVLVLYAGQCVEECTTEQLFKRPLHPYSQGLIACAAGITQKGRLKTIEGTPPAPGTIFEGCPFEPRCPKKLERCKFQNPEMFNLGQRKSRCWLNANEEYLGD
ncbi:ABC-type dipeptide/oligopeptide/nickel transport system [Elusimicrobium minutum Pei191]|uniref:ABC-type dipeptide/oligopeptide/nickel transport system n=1 Tax=Elusimicrobium minutum (strain Pei191) TaxID=445932 RepID=B2KE37_ELUMP|nr:ABC transporter ATP-binding protein [Elusimicrobium minutum]ACC98783.1 ABC-type dipeptide/oligopeptide/nickel transport system [Elusimicrobium minutum Pei191]